jgi:hypothetical protein
MRFRNQFIVGSCLALCLLISPAVLIAKEHSIGDKIVRVLEANRTGECPDNLMGPILLDICEQQVHIMKKRLADLGETKRAEYKGVEKLQNGVRAEVYKIHFANGTMMWMATQDADGKLNFLWSPG